jgi:hypothetical protein
MVVSGYVSIVGTRLGKDRRMINLLVWIMFGLTVYAIYWFMVHSTTPESVACDECNADIGEPCRPYCIGLDTEDL